MPKRVDITNQRFGKLVALKRAPNIKDKTAWYCQCDCGETPIIRTNTLKSGRAKSCGCAREEHPRFRNKKHGHRTKKDNGQRSSKEYRCWLYVKALDSCPQSWKDDFSTFLSDVGDAPSDEHSLTRKNNQIPYSKNNVHWFTYGDLNDRREQSTDFLDMRSI